MQFYHTLTKQYICNYTLLPSPCTLSQVVTRSQLYEWDSTYSPITLAPNNHHHHPTLNINITLTSGSELPYKALLDENWKCFTSLFSLTLSMFLIFPFYDLRWTAEMSKATKRKHVTKEVLDEFILPTENQQVVRVSIGLVSIKQNVNNTYQFCMD